MANSRKDKKGRVLKTGESQRADSTYMYRWTNMYGKRNSIYAKTLNELRKLEDNITYELSNGVGRTNITLNEQIETYFNTRSDLAVSTISNYTYYWNKEIRDSIGKLRIIDIKKSDILVFYRKLYGKGLSNGTIRIFHKIIHPALSLAVDDNILLKNPSDNCVKDYQIKKETKYALSIEEEKEFFDRIKTMKYAKYYYPFFSIMLYTGMRIGEIIGLTWEDISFEKRELSVNHQMLQRQIDGKLCHYCSKNTKTSSGKRTIYLSETLLRLFHQQKKVWLSTVKDNEYELDGFSDFVFISYRTGRPWHQNNIRRTLRKIVDMNECREIQLPNISPHILRHTLCTRMAESGIDIKVVQAYLGHADLRTTIQVYNHVDKERSVRELKKMDTLYENLRERLS